MGSTASAMKPLRWVSFIDRWVSSSQFRRLPRAPRAPVMAGESLLTANHATRHSKRSLFFKVFPMLKIEEESQTKTWTQV